MGQPYGGPNRDARDPRDRGNGPYTQTPASSQLYPPLGYASDGTALFTPGQPTNTELRAAEQAEREQARAAAEAAAGADDETRIPKVSTTSLIVCLGLVVLVAVAIVGFSGMFRNEPTEPPLADPPTTIDTVPLPRTFEPPRLTPDGPGGSAPGGPDERVNPQDKPVTYEVAIDGQATILYVDAMGLRSEFAPSNPWSVEFTGSDNPLRLLVIAGTGSGAKCSITVDGKVVVKDTVTASSARRTASCIA